MLEFYKKAPMLIVKTFLYFEKCHCVSKGYIYFLDTSLKLFEVSNNILKFLYHSVFITFRNMQLEK